MADCEKVDFTESNECSNLTIGFDFTLNGTVSTEGVAEDITGRTYTLTIKDGIGGTTLLTATNRVDFAGTGFWLNDPTNGLFKLRIAVADVATIGEGTHVYEITETDTAGIVSPFSYGAMQVKAGNI